MAVETSQTAEISGAVEPEVFDGETGLPIDTTPVKRRRRSLDLETVRGCRLEAAQLYKLVKRGKLQPEAATKMVWHLRQVAELVVIGELERRVDELTALNAQRALPAG